MTKFLKSNLLRNKLKSNLLKKNKKKPLLIKDSKKQKENESLNTQMEIDNSDKLIENKNKNKIKQTKPNNNKNFNKEQSLIKKEKTKKVEETIQPQLSVDSIKEHYYTFNLVPELCTILYTTLIFKWIQTDRVIN